jgi:hypothetical protein
MWNWSWNCYFCVDSTEANIQVFALVYWETCKEQQKEQRVFSLRIEIKPFLPKTRRLSSQPQLYERLELGFMK